MVSTERTSEDKPANDAFTAPSISLPRGGGAVRGIGEKFSANPVTGTGSFSVPLAVSPGRSGFGPQLSLSYDSGAGNGPFGFGWDLALPRVSRKTDRGLPRYLEDDSDTFILSGAEDLVRELEETAGELHATETRRTVHGIDYRIRRFRPRIEGLFARIEQWTDTTNGETHWRSISKDNVTTLYGRTENSRIADPDDSTRVFSWLICESYDDRGNVIVYEYKAENSDGVDVGQAHEANRTDRARSANRYLKRIRYGAGAPYFPVLAPAGPETPPPATWHFEVIFDYGEHDPLAPTPAETASWSVRPDPFSVYRAGFEVRAYRLCRRVLMFHHFPDEAGVGADCLVRSTDLAYRSDTDPAASRSAVFSFLSEIEQAGYVRSETGGYFRRAMPPLVLGYTEPIAGQTVAEVDADSLANLPGGVSGPAAQWIDLDGEGLSGVLLREPGGWFYKRNLSPAASGDGGAGRVELGGLERIAGLPSLTGGSQQFLDLDGDGQLALVDFHGPTPGFFERTPEGGWGAFTPFNALPALDWTSPNLKFIDLTGDGFADVLVTEHDAFCWHAALGEAGYSASERAPWASDEERGPRLVSAGRDESIYLADFSGDGLSDIARIRNGEICYWPNLGYGRFGAKVSMDRSPLFDLPDAFDQRRIRLADIDGSGTTDILYLGAAGVSAYFNESGNAWSEALELDFPAVDDVAAVHVTDLFGNGTACLVWSSPLPAEAGRSVRYVDLLGGQKPHLLTAIENNLGAETHIRYAPSTRFYLQDKRAGRPWLTKLPFPVHVVERVETLDRISGNRFVTRHAYHHGYFDGAEREFRGFGMVEQWDTEQFAMLDEAANNVDEASHVPPVYTKTWFHTGAYLERQRISQGFVDEYYRMPDATGEEDLLEDTVLPEGLSVEEEREACRALKGRLLRREVYALDGSENEPHPYSVTEQNFTLRRLQPRDANQHAVFLVHPRETQAFQYERHPEDPRVSHTFTLDVDAYGNVLASASIVYGRCSPDPMLPLEDQAEQARRYATCAEHRFTNPVEDEDAHRTPLPAETRMYELTGLVPASERCSFDEVDEAVRTAAALSYEETPAGGVEKRLIEHVRTYYRPNDLGASTADALALLPLGALESLAVSGARYRLALSPGLLAQVYEGRVSDEILAEGGYVQMEDDAGWWMPSGRVFFSAGSDDAPEEELAAARAGFFLSRRFRDPFHASGFDTESRIAYDDYHLLMRETRDALGNAVGAENDYRVLQPRLTTDPNGNQTEAAFDALGLVVGTAVMGKPGDAEGDSLAGFVPDLDDEVALAHLDDPLVNPYEVLQDASIRMVYDLFAYVRTKDTATPAPAVVYSLVRETHVSDAGADPVRIQHRFVYSDGLGREVQTKLQAEPGPVVPGAPVVDPRWVGSGWTLFDNKGNPVRQYEPFFSATHRYEPEVQHGVSPVLFYDPPGRAAATLHPNHTWEKVVFDAWQQESWDVNDTAAIENPAEDADVGGYFRRLAAADYLPTWYAARIDGTMGAAEQTAAEKTAMHGGTPTVTYFDSLGRAFLTQTHNRFERDNNGANETVDEYATTRTLFDIEGNPIDVIDARGLVVMHYDYDIAGNVIRTTSMDAGDRWMLNDAAGQPLRAWDTRGHAFRTEYDRLRRPIHQFVSGTGGDADPRLGNLEVLFQKTEYGEGQSGDAAANLRTRVYRNHDGAGVVTSEVYDFKGNLLRGTRQIAVDYTSIPNWNASVQLEADVFLTETEYDALNRPITLVTPDASIVRPSYNEAGLLERIDANLRGETQATPFVTDIEYNAKGQRERIVYGNGVITEYAHDPLTYRLQRLKSTHDAGGDLQDYTYSYDPAGNILSVQDAAQQNIFFAGAVVSPDADFTYDALYQLIAASGREHIGLTTQIDHNDPLQRSVPNTNDDPAMRAYTERYEYDAVGNIMKMIHQATAGSWTRNYEYDAANNRLLGTSLPGDPDGVYTASYNYNLHGSMASMPHLPAIAWDFQERMQSTDLGGGGTVHYVYDGAGQRVRKIHEHLGATTEERIYLGGFEIYRKHVNGGLDFEREILHVMDGEQRIALVETKTVDGGSPLADTAIRYQLNNHLGSSCLEVDAAGRVISYEEYHPYGTTAYRAGTGAAQVSLKRYRYTGKEKDEETGLYYHGARYYACWLGRWTAADPIGIGDGVNVYGYVGNRPLNYWDPSGTDGIVIGREIVWRWDDNSLTPSYIPFVPDYKFEPDYWKRKFDEAYARREIVDPMDWDINFLAPLGRALEDLQYGYYVDPRDVVDDTLKGVSEWINFVISESKFFSPELPILPARAPKVPTKLEKKAPELLRDATEVVVEPLKKGPVLKKAADDAFDRSVPGVEDIPEAVQDHINSTTETPELTPEVEPASEPWSLTESAKDLYDQALKAWNEYWNPPEPVGLEPTAGSEALTPSPFETFGFESPPVVPGTNNSELLHQEQRL